MLGLSRSPAVRLFSKPRRRPVPSRVLNLPGASRRRPAQTLIMTGIISAISGHFSKSLLLGTFLPSLLFVVLGLILVPPLLPANWQPWEQLQSVDTQGVVSVSFVTVVLTGLLYNLNPPIIRFYEGYTWKGSLLGRLRMRHYRRLAGAAPGAGPPPPPPPPHQKHPQGPGGLARPRAWSRASPTPTSP